MNRSALLVLLMLADATLGELQKRVIGGRDCGNTEALHHVVLTVKGKDGKPDLSDYHCGGSLISADWILTAAHCDEPNLVAVLNLHPDKTKQEVGKISLKRQYNTPNKPEPHDIMLLKLQTSVSHPHTVQLPPLSCNTPTSTTKVLFNGWFTTAVQQGKKVKNTVHTLNLQCGDLEIVQCPSFSQYQNNQNQYLRSLAYNQFVCAKDPGRTVDECKGDSGGSMTIQGVLYGVLHGGYEDFCAFPVLFMDVCRYRAWINTETGL